MLKKFIIPLFLILVTTLPCLGQCSICTKTAAQLGEGPAHGLNTAILYLMAAPFLIMGFIFYRWWKKEKELEKADL